MELLIIIAVVSFVMKMISQKNDTKAEKSMPPFSNGKPSTQTHKRAEQSEARSLEDFTREIFGQMQQKVEQVKRESAPEPVVETQVEQVKQSARQTREEVRAQLNDKRPALGENRAIIQRERKKSNSIKIPKTRNDLMQTIVMTEVLGKPKAKR